MSVTLLMLKRPSSCVMFPLNVRPVCSRDLLPSSSKAVTVAPFTKGPFWLTPLMLAFSTSYVTSPVSITEAPEPPFRFIVNEPSPHLTVTVESVWLTMEQPTPSLPSSPLEPATPFFTTPMLSPLQIIFRPEPSANSFEEQL